MCGADLAGKWKWNDVVTERGYSEYTGSLKCITPYVYNGGAITPRALKQNRSIFMSNEVLQKYRSSPKHGIVKKLCDKCMSQRKCFGAKRYRYQTVRNGNGPRKRQERVEMSMAIVSIYTHYAHISCTGRSFISIKNLYVLVLAIGKSELGFHSSFSLTAL
jgi:hypothetical protein